MKKFAAFLASVLLMLTIQLAGNCSQPLDSIDGNGYFIIDTLYIVDSAGSADTNIIIIVDTIRTGDTIYTHDTLVVKDTIFVTDTLIFTDTVETFDTVYSIDTVTYVDTVAVIDTMYCGRISSHQKEIVWMLNPVEGTSSLEFQSSVDNDHNLPILVIEIDGIQYNWDISESTYFTIEYVIGNGTTVWIYSNPPHAYGHAIDICLHIMEE